VSKTGRVGRRTLRFAALIAYRLAPRAEADLEDTAFHVLSTAAASKSLIG
jgi:hypothetical protein